MSHSGFGGDTENFSRVFIDNRQYLVTAAITQFVVNTIDTPDMIWVLRPKTNNETTLVIQPFALLMAMRQLKVFFSPYPLDTLVINAPPFNP